MYGSQPLAHIGRGQGMAVTNAGKRTRCFNTQHTMVTTTLTVVLDSLSHLLQATLSIKVIDDLQGDRNIHKRHVSNQCRKRQGMREGRTQAKVIQKRRR